MTGGGSGGHITPILAVAHELKQLQPDATLVYIGQRGDPFGAVVAKNPLIDEVHLVSAGKFRRYHGDGLKQLLDIPTMLLNIRDAFLVVAGLWQSYRLFRRLRPDVVFCKGGFIGVPVGLAAALRHVPYVTHDSDAMPGLANRIVSRWAALHAVALDTKLYPYPKERTVNVGVPVAAEYELVNSEQQILFRKQIGLVDYEKVVVITGGGLGAARLNHAAAAIMPELLRREPRLAVVHMAGTKHTKVVQEAYDATLTPEARNRVRVLGYTTELFKYTGAADVVIARGGATSLAELAAQGKACIIVPNPQLTGGHQLKNARAYEERGAVVCIDESILKANQEVLLGAVQKLLEDATERTNLSERLHSFNRDNSAEELAELILKVAGEG